MAYQPEQPNYDVGVYQIETTDPVDGGVGSITNSPLLSLANRTAYLYLHVTNLENGTTQPPGMAPLNSPAFTGTPTTPTPPAGDSSTRIANTIWTQGLVNGISTVNCAGSANVVLTAAQAGVAVIELVGALTGNIAVIVPTPPGNWIISNQTTGAFTVTVRTAAGNGIMVAQGYSNELWSDGANVYTSRTDFTGIAISGATANTAPAGDQSNKIANTQFAYNLKNGVVTVPVGGAANIALTAAQYGSGILLLTGALTASIEVFVPGQGGTYVVANNTTGAFSLKMGVSGSAGATALVPQGQSVIVYCDGTNTVLAGAAASSSFQASTFTAGAGQTTFNLSYTPGNILVTQNGVTVSSVNYTATNGSSVTINSTVTTGDEIVIYAFASFTVANAVTWTGGAMAGPLALHGGDTGVSPAALDSSNKLVTTAWANGVGACVGSMRNLRTNLTAAGTSITFTADEIVVENALGGAPYRLGNFNQTLNGTVTGIGGIDAGVIAASSSYAIYAAYNATGQLAGIFGQLEPASGATSTYTGANLPPGYTATALISVWLTNSSAQFAQGFQNDRHVTVASLVSNIYTSALTNTAVTLAVPYSARSVDVAVAQTTATAATQYNAALASASPVNGGLSTFSQALTGTGLVLLTTNGRVYPLSPRTAYGTWVVNGGSSPQLTISIAGYEF